MLATPLLLYQEGKKGFSGMRLMIPTLAFWMGLKHSGKMKQLTCSSIRWKKAPAMALAEPPNCMKACPNSMAGTWTSVQPALQIKMIMINCQPICMAVVIHHCLLCIFLYKTAMMLGKIWNYFLRCQSHPFRHQTPPHQKGTLF